MANIKHVGVSKDKSEQLQLFPAVVPINDGQTERNPSNLEWDEVVDFCAEREILFVPFFPLRGGDPAAVAQVASELGATAHQVKLAWLLKRSPAMLPIPGTLNIEHVRENLGALDVQLTDDQFTRLSP